MALWRFRGTFPGQPASSVKVGLWLRSVSLCTAGFVMPASATTDIVRELLLCRANPSDAQRLLCYDALVAAGNPRGGFSTASGVGGSPAMAAGLSPSGGAKSSAEQTFGLATRARDADPSEIESSIKGSFKGWLAGDRIELANGQLWQVIDDSVGVMNVNNPKVTVRRGSFDTFYLELEGTNRSPRVKRVR
jgi:hypothetical protein